ncbi:MAG: ABC transporter ATP-binding protein [Verrucomicrobiota bacterium]
MKDSFLKLWRLFTRRERKSFLLFFGFMLIGTLMETVGLGLVLPLVAFLTVDDLESTYPFLHTVSAALGEPTKNELIYGVVGLLIAVYLLKTVFMVWLSWKQAGLFLRAQANLASRLMETYLEQPWNDFISRNSSEYVQTVNNETALVMTHGFNSAVEFVKNAILLVAAMVLLMCVQPVATLVVIMIFSIMAGTFLISSRVRVSHWGKIRKHHEQLRLQTLQNTLRSAKSVKLASKEDFFVSEFLRHCENLVRSGQWQSTLRGLPKQVFELVGVVALGLIIFVTTMQGTSLDAVTPLIALFVAVFIRLLPSVNAILAGLHSIRYIEPTIIAMHEELTREKHYIEPDEEAPEITLNSEIELRDISFTYKGAEQKSLDRVSIQIPQGTFLGIVGESGAGKSTLVDVLLGFLHPDEGALLCDGVGIHKALDSWRRKVGYVPQFIFLLDDTLARNIAFGLDDEEINMNRVQEALEVAQLESVVARFPEGVHTVIGEDGSQLSGGEKQRIGIARALYNDPEVLILDEASASLDEKTEAALLSAVEILKGEKTIISISHRPKTIEYCDMVIRLDQGRIDSVKIKGAEAPTTTG